jgi:hypothetical protein
VFPPFAIEARFSPRYIDAKNEFGVLCAILFVVRPNAVVGQFPINAVISMGRRNTKLEPTCIENRSQSCSLGLDQPERYSGWVLTE